MLYKKKIRMRANFQEMRWAFLNATIPVKHILVGIVCASLCFALGISAHNLFFVPPNEDNNGSNNADWSYILATLPLENWHMFGRDIYHTAWTTHPSRVVFGLVGPLEGEVTAGPVISSNVVFLGTYNSTSGKGFVYEIDTLSLKVIASDSFDGQIPVGIVSVPIEALGITRNLIFVETVESEGGRAWLYWLRERVTPPGGTFDVIAKMPLPLPLAILVIRPPPADFIWYEGSLIVGAGEYLYYIDPLVVGSFGKVWVTHVDPNGYVPPLDSDDLADLGLPEGTEVINYTCDPEVKATYIRNVAVHGDKIYAIIETFQEGTERVCFHLPFCRIYCTTIRYYSLTFELGVFDLYNGSLLWKIYICGDTAVNRPNLRAWAMFSLDPTQNVIWIPCVHMKNDYNVTVYDIELNQTTSISVNEYGIPYAPPAIALENVTGRYRHLEAGTVFQVVYNADENCTYVMPLKYDRGTGITILRTCLLYTSPSPRDRG